jgi:hypothetical protein
VIIGYYPGSGGNRYYRYLTGLDFYSTDTYDGAPDTHDVHGGIFKSWYFDTDTTFNQTCPYVLTHCVNHARLMKMLPPQEVVIIKADMMSSLRRRFNVGGLSIGDRHEVFEKTVVEIYNDTKRDSYQDITDLIKYAIIDQDAMKEARYEARKLLSDSHNTMFMAFSNAFSSIVWHANLYKLYPLEVANSRVVDIDNDDTEFAKVMRHELNRYNDDAMFNYALEVYRDYGDDAKIFDFYDEYIRQ